MIAAALWKILLILHPSAGAVGLVSGAATLSVRKGGWLHQTLGTTFFLAMLTMSGLGAILAVLVTSRISIAVGVLTFYLTATAWATVRRAPGRCGRFEIVAALGACGAAAACILLGVWAARSPGGLLDGQPALPTLVFGGIAALAAALDCKMILRGGVFGALRITRHLWRMCMALLIAALSFFLGRQQAFPKALQGSPILMIPEIAIVAVMIFWLARVRLSARGATLPASASEKPDRSPAPAHEIAGASPSSN